MTNFGYACLALGVVDTHIYITPCKFLPPAFTLFVRSLNNFLVLSLLFMYTLMFVIKLFQLRTQVELQNKQEIEHQKLALMLAQIKPHFMYNTLICIDSLIDTDPQTARQLLLHFSQYMRANIDSLTDNDLIPFSEELSHTLTYVDIISICFNHEIHLELNLKEENFSIPPLTLQPIVENAIKHGKLIDNPQSSITISTWTKAAEYIVQITDNGIGFDADTQENKSRSVGLKNVAFRMQTLCCGELTIDSAQGIGTTVTLRIPFSKQ